MIIIIVAHPVTREERNTTNKKIFDVGAKLATNEHEYAQLTMQPVDINSNPFTRPMKERLN